MITSRELENKRKGYRSIQGVVKAMKALSAANVRKGGLVLEHTRRYRDFLDRTAAIASSLPGVSIAPPGGKRLLVAFGSEYGLCGAMNERVLEALSETEKKLVGVVGLIFVGRRFSDMAPIGGPLPVEKVEAPGSAEGLDDSVNELLTVIYRKYKDREFDEMRFIYPAYAADILTVKAQTVLPPPFKPGGEIPEPPLLYIPASEVMDALLEEYLYVSLYSTALETLIAENESRMRTMDYAEKNIRKKIEELTASYNYAVQEEVTGELLEIISGYEALGKPGQPL